MHVLSAEQYDRESLEGIFESTERMRHDFTVDRQGLAARHLGTQATLLFYEPSTRTRLSFSHGAHHLGMSVNSTENAREFSSAAKGETIQDTIRVLNEYHPDVVVIRHHETGEVAKAAEVSDVPVINAGDGKGEHPTQALLDSYTIWKNFGKDINGLRIVIGGDLLNGRTARSLAKLLCVFEGNHLVFNSIPELQMAHDVKQYLKDKNVSFEETEDMKTAFTDADVVYWTRLQRERLPQGVEVGQTYIVDEKAMSYLPGSSIVMHPLPRIDEIKTEVDADPRAHYFEQAGNGMFVRMALLDQLLSA